MSRIALSHPEPEAFVLASVLKALGDPDRLAIVKRLESGPQDIGECFLENPDVPKSTRSHLMKVLREAGVIRNDPSPKGPGRQVSLRRDELNERFPGLLEAVLSSARS